MGIYGTIKENETKEFKENKNNEKISKIENILIDPIKNTKFPKKDKLDIPNPNFIKKETIIDNYIHNSFEIYKLKNINDSFFIVFSTMKKSGLTIYKYIYKTKKFKHVYYINNLHISDKQIKYFYNPINDTEYLYILNCGSIYIYLIYNEANYILINSINKHYDNYYDLYSINFFDIIYNKFSNNIYIIIYSSYWNNQSCIELIKIKDNEYQLITSFPLNQRDNLSKNKFIIYKDKYNKKYNIITEKNNIPKMIEIKDDYNYINFDENIQNIVASKNGEKNLSNFCYESTHKYINIIYDDTRKNKDYLYIGNREGKILIIDLIEKNIVKNISLNINIYSFINWNNKYIIFLTKNSVAIYEKNSEKIITQYINFLGVGKDIYNVKIHFSYEYNFYSLFICGNKEIVLVNI